MVYELRLVAWLLSVAREIMTLGHSGGDNARGGYDEPHTQMKTTRTREGSSCHHIT